MSDAGWRVVRRLPGQPEQMVALRFRQSVTPPMATTPLRRRPCSTVLAAVRTTAQKSAGSLDEALPSHVVTAGRPNGRSDVELAVADAKSERFPLGRGVPERRIFRVRGVPHGDGAAWEMCDLDPVARIASGGTGPLRFAQIEGVQGALVLYVSRHLRGCRFVSR